MKKYIRDVFFLAIFIGGSGFLALMGINAELELNQKHPVSDSGEHLLVAHAAGYPERGIPPGLRDFTACEYPALRGSPTMRGRWIFRLPECSCQVVVADVTAKGVGWDFFNYRKTGALNYRLQCRSTRFEQAAERRPVDDTRSNGAGSLGISSKGNLSYELGGGLGVTTKGKMVVGGVELP
jgi:hypothetical protein